MQTKKIAIKGSTLALKPRLDVATDPKQWIFLQTHNIGNNPFIGISGFTGESQRPGFNPHWGQHFLTGFFYFHVVKPLMLILTLLSISSSLSKTLIPKSIHKLNIP